MITRRGVIGGAAAGVALTALAGPADAGPVVSRTLTTGLKTPWGIGFLPSGDALVTSRETGAVHRVRRRGGRSRIGTIACDGAAEGEGGLLGVAVSPRFADDRRVYFYRTFDGANQVVSMDYRQGALSGLQVLLDGIPAARVHNGGGLAFGPDGHLYASTGDAMVGSDAQDPASLAGKILRLTATGGIPDDNPSGTAVWTSGHRNVQGLAWDATGRMFATEYGQHERDELNEIVAGDNYGWPVVEGGDGEGGVYHDPFAVWSPTRTCSPSGLTVARNRAWVASLRGESLCSVRLTGPDAGSKTRHFAGRFGRVRNVEAAPDGSLWLATSNTDQNGTPRRKDDRIIRIVLR